MTHIRTRKKKKKLGNQHRPLYTTRTINSYLVPGILRVKEKENDAYDERTRKKGNRKKKKKKKYDQGEIRTHANEN